MSTAIAPPRAGVKEEQPYVDPTKKRYTGRKLLGLVVVWVALWLVVKNRDTLELPFAQTTGLHTWLNDFRDSIEGSGQSNWFMKYVIGGISAALNGIITALQGLLSTAVFPRPVPEIGWLGVMALIGWVTYALAGIRSTILVLVCTFLFGVFGLWQFSIDLLIVTFVAVFICVIIGLPLGILMARNQRVSAVVTPVLDLMQTMPSFAYLTPMALFFGIGPACAVAVTLVYAIPPLVRITEHGIKSVSANTIEASRSLGLTSRQLLRQVQLPMARRTIIVGVNQCTMAALSMATIAALVNGPGLGKPVVSALQTLNIGAAFVGGLAIVLMAIMLDRTTTAASERAERRGGHTDVASVGGPGVVKNIVWLERLPRWASEEGYESPPRKHLSNAGRRFAIGLLVVPVLMAVVLSRTYLSLAQFGSFENVPVLSFLSGPKLASVVNTVVRSFVDAVDTFTNGFKEVVTVWFLNPLQALIATSPWWLMALVLLAIAYFLGGWRPTVVTAVCEAVILGTGLWNDAMVTLTMTLVATLLVMIIAVVLGVGMGRSRRVDVIIRPFLDAFQTIPAFVYLVPALALFGPGRFTAIVAALVYAVSIATKLVADGIRGVSPTTVEAARSSGVTPWQMISKVQLPMAREALVLATNQGLLYVLSMVVIGGMVGGGSLGYIVVAGFSQRELFGKGLAAGLAITALGVMLDRIARHAAARYES